MTKIDAFYGRNSSDEQAERGTIQAQVEFAKKYFDLHEIKEYEMYLDEGVSGTKALKDRDDSARMLEDVKAGRVKTVYVYRLDRLARSVKHVIDTYDFLESHDVRLVSMTEAFDTATPTGKFFMTLLASIAALERETILERTQLGKQRRARAGNWVSGAAPFGYRITDEKKLEIYEPEAETVKLVFSLYREGMSTVEVAKYLNAREIPTPSRSKGTRNKSVGKWHAGHISIILRNKAYSGFYEYLKRSKKRTETIKMEVPQIIDQELFNHTQHLLSVNADVARGKKGRNYLLRGLIYCGECGRAMVGSSGDSKSGRVYYRCTGTFDMGQGKTCNSKMVRATAIEAAAWQDVKEILMHPEQFTEIVEKVLAKNKQDAEPIQNELAEIEEAILSKQTARKNILSLLTRSKITESEADAELETLASEISSLTARKEFLFSRQESSKQMEIDIINTKMVFDLIKESLDEINEEDKAGLIRRMIRRIDVFTKLNEQGKRVSVSRYHYRFDRGVELNNSGNSQNKTIFYNLESTWQFQAFSRIGGERIGWR